MRNCLYLLSFLLVLGFSSCGGDNDVDNSNLKESAEQEQEKLFNEMKSSIVGHWVGVQHYNTPKMGDWGWEDISNISWSTSWTFYSDGTYTEHYDGVGDTHGTYTICKNSYYISEPRSYCALFLKMVWNNGPHEEEKWVWFDGAFLRLGYKMSDIERKPSDSSGGEASIRYAKQ